MNYLKKITIINIKKPKEQNLNQELQWFSNCLGMFNKRDKEKSCFRIFISFLNEKAPLSSDQIAQKTHLSRATVIHHISRLRNTGIIIEKEKRYFLRINKLEDLTKEIEKDVISTFRELKKISKKIDEELS